MGGEYDTWAYPQSVTIRRLPSHYFFRLSLAICSSLDNALARMLRLRRGMDSNEWPTSKLSRKNKKKMDDDDFKVGSKASGAPQFIGIVL